MLRTSRTGQSTRTGRSTRAARTARTAGPIVAAIAAGAALLPAPAWAGEHRPGPAPQSHGRGAGLPPSGAIQHIIVIDLENESFPATFGPGSPATYLNGTLVPAGELLQDYFATGHVSLDNYISQVSGQAPNGITSSDCVTSLTALTGSYNDLVPGTLDRDQRRYPGQAEGQGCVMPRSVQTIGDQLESQDQQGRYAHSITPDWREYAEDMGNDPTRDGGQTDSLGGTDCAHPTQTGGVAGDDTNAAEGPNATGSQIKSTVTDQYADRHNPFIYFHSVTDNTASCDAHVVPLGTVTVGTGGQPDTFHGHLAADLAHAATTPRFSFITPNLCDDGHDATCAGTNVEGGTTGGLVGADLWLKHWMPLILNSPAYRSGTTLVVITFDEGAITDTQAGDHERPGPNSANPGYSPLLNTPSPALGGATYYQLLGVTGLTPNVEPPAGTMPGGGQIGALLLNPAWVRAGTVDTARSYNHYSALRTYEDLLGIHTGGADHHGHLGFAATASDFGPDVWNLRPHQR